ncbi:hypothetical protein F4775DRAFT_29225 [Biscogniauxia sp. FL1348]|nr:hypothetical protein F4775DRAFT_29225 [Biscogniauxia sp. FL1348]
MQRLGNPGLVQRLPAKTPWDPQVRYAHNKRPWPKRKVVPMRKQFPTFEASTLLLDLDAEDNKYVRPYDEELDGVPESAAEFRAREMLPFKKRVEDFEILSKQYDEASKATTSQKFSVWQISDPDIFAATLLGVSPTSAIVNPDGAPKPTSSSPPDKINEYILDQNGIPHIVRHSTAGVVQYMMNRQRLARLRSQMSDDEESLEHALKRCQILAEVQRLTGRLIQTPEGCRLVAESASAIVDICKDGLNQVPPTHVLSFLNDLTISLSHQVQQIPAELPEYGLEIALQSRVFETAQMYLKILLTAGHGLSNSATIQTLKSLRAFVTPDPMGDANPTFGNDISRYLAIFSLLTGQELGQGSLQPSLRDLISDPVGECYQIYMECLAQMGAFRTMWHEWKQVEVHKDRHEDQEEMYKETAFTNAIQFAINSNNGIRDLVRSKDFTVATGQYHEDYRLDMKSILKSADLTRLRREQPPQHNTDVQPDMYDRGKIIQVFNRESIQETLLALQVLLA